MPFVQIDLTPDGLTKETKQALILGISQLLQDLLNKDPALTHVIIREVNTDNWGLAGEQVSVNRALQNKK